MLGKAEKLEGLRPQPASAPHCGSKASLVRFADDFVGCFQFQDDGHASTLRAILRQGHTRIDRMRILGKKRLSPREQQREVPTGANKKFGRVCRAYVAWSRR